MADQNRRSDSRPMSAEERGRKGGETTARQHPGQYSEMGKKARQQKSDDTRSEGGEQHSQSNNANNSWSDGFDTDR